MFNLEDFRKSKKLNQAEFAKILDTSQRVYSNIETGDSILSIKNGLKIANHFGLTLDYIYSQYLTTKETNLEVQEKINLLSDKDKEVVLTLIDTLLSK